MPMKIRAAIQVCILAAVLVVFPVEQANAGCRDFPESVTPECVAQNLAEEQIRQVEAEAQRVRDIAAAERAAAENAQRQYEANGSRPCTLFPASITPECAAENLIYEAQRQAVAEVQRGLDMAAAEKAAVDQAEREYIANGSRPCTLYPASITTECAAENLKFAKIEQGLTAKKAIKDAEKAIKAAAAQQRADYIREGSRPCSLYPASITPECAAENLEWTAQISVQRDALSAWQLENTGKTKAVIRDDNNDLLILAKVPSGVDLLTGTVRLLNSKGKVVATGEIRYDSSLTPYYYFGDFEKQGTYSVQLASKKKKVTLTTIKL